MLCRLRLFLICFTSKVKFVIVYYGLSAILLTWMFESFLLLKNNIQDKTARDVSGIKHKIILLLVFIQGRKRVGGGEN